MERNQRNGRSDRASPSSSGTGKSDYRRNKGGFKSSGRDSSRGSRDSGRSYKSRDSSRGNRDSAPRRVYGNRDTGKTQRFSAVCSGCGKKCEVPFEPKGGKPVLCDRCYKVSEGVETKNNFRAPRTSSGVPSSMFPGRRGNSDSGRITGTVAELKEINRKLERIMRAMGLNED